MYKVNLQEKFNLFNDTWHPHIVGALNGQHVKLAKLQGEFVWHHHEQEDELFLVIAGELTIQFRDREILLQAGEFLIVPRGVEHRPVAERLCQVLLLEPVSTVNTGSAPGEMTVENPEWI
jgi:mannose-6-phosphate isomerase-like protein (cupin superfamily)